MRGPGPRACAARPRGIPRRPAARERARGPRRGAPSGPIASRPRSHDVGAGRLQSPVRDLAAGGPVVPAQRVRQRADVSVRIAAGVPAHAEVAFGRRELAVAGQVRRTLAALGPGLALRDAVAAVAPDVPAERVDVNALVRDAVAVARAHPRGRDGPPALVELRLELVAELFVADVLAEVGIPRA